MVSRLSNGTVHSFSLGKETPKDAQASSLCLARALAPSLSDLPGGILNTGEVEHGLVGGVAHSPGFLF